MVINSKNIKILRTSFMEGPYGEITAVYARGKKSDFHEFESFYLCFLAFALLKAIMTVLNEDLYFEKNKNTRGIFCIPVWLYFLNKCRHGNSNPREVPVCH